MLDLERDTLKQARLKMTSPLFAVRIRVYADSKDKVYEVAQAFNQFSGNSFRFKVRELRNKDLRIAEEHIPLRLSRIFKDKKLLVLSARELALFVNLPTPNPSLPLRTGYISLELPPSLLGIGLGKGELKVEKLKNLVTNDVIPLGLHGDVLIGIPFEEFREHIKQYSVLLVLVSRPSLGT